MTLNGAKILRRRQAASGRSPPASSPTSSSSAATRSRRPAEIRNVTIVFKDGVGYDSPKLLASVKGLVGIR